MSDSKPAAHILGCEWEPEREHCTCGALVLTKAYRFSHGGVIAFDQFGQQMPYYQQWHGVGEQRIRRDYPAVAIVAGEVAR